MLTKKHIIQEFFYFFSFLMFAFIVLDFISPNLVSVYFNLNILFLVWLVSATLLLCIKIKK